MQFQLNETIVERVLSVVDQGLVKGLGTPVPGKMCVEAAVCFALGLPHSDEPKCVSSAVRSLKITLNDTNWSSNSARADGMRKLAVLQLGTKDSFDDKLFAKNVALYVVNVIVADLFETLGPKYAAHTKAMRSASTLAEAKTAADNAAYSAMAGSVIGLPYSAAKTAAYSAAYSANAANVAAYSNNAAANAANAAAYSANAAYSAAAKKPGEVRDAILAKFAEGVCQILIGMNVPGVEFLSLIES